MIFYFSGTGNSLWVAKQLGAYFDEKLVSIADELNKEENNFQYHLADSEKVFFVFPVHSWGPAVLVLRFIEKMNLDNYSAQQVYAVCVCGDNCGYTDRIMQKELMQKNVLLTRTYSIQMPNNYILMKGFGIDTEEIKNEKLELAPSLIKEIEEDIQSGKHKNLYVSGKKSFLKSRIVYPAFKNYALGRNSFFATDACTSCGLCARVCPTNTISLVNKKPVWNNTCVQCTACIHRCPVRAIEYGKITRNQGRYHHPDM
ncbi:ferredoxin [Paludibacter sp. 221]|uniref:EFR1 family ferrodoxin n=1 Tax=Paludibacter sp. 221 TaxID=2302939 RepID=UPI0013D1A8A7|nr:EFR1 family ferrodoxin [Paludibacter sp. 221]NDV47335.1 ferredoxin [Paludibacter sp. 221]